MDALLRRFFWSGSLNKKSIHWIKGQFLCDAKEEDDLSLRSFREFNLALLAKQSWRLLTNPNSLWGRLLKRMYFPRTNFLSAKKGSRPSWIWASLWEARNLMRKGTIRFIGNGQSARAFNDPWILGMNGEAISTGTNDNTLVADLINGQSRSWNSHIFPPLVDSVFSQRIESIPIGTEEAKDFLA
ncbi:unnamed protein product [Linum trigynum]|uniref:Uncharacterized protein n=1 Tax=Linum trigynum TaxID=586398 RepID=A0AAV2F6J5_9ROSI